MMHIRNILFLITLISFLSIHSQAKKDSLNQLNNIDILDAIYDSVDTSEGFKISGLLVKKARKEGDSIAVAWGYYGKYINSSEEINSVYLDSIIDATVGSKDPDHPLWGYSLKAQHHYLNDSFDVALDLYILVNEQAKKEGNNYYITSSFSGIANIKLLTKDYLESLQMYRKVGSYIEKTPRQDERIAQIKSNINNIGLSHYYLRHKDSLRFYAKKGLKMISSSQDEFYPSFLRLNSLSDILDQQHQKAIDSLHKSLPITEDSTLIKNVYYYLSLAQEGLKREDSTFYYLSKIDSLNEPVEVYFPEIKEVYFKLYKISQKQNNVENQITYMDKFLKSDSILSSKLHKLIGTIGNDYDIPLIKSEKAKLIALTRNNKKSKLIIYALIAAFMIIVPFFAYQYYNTKKRIRKMIEQPAVVLDKIEKTKDQSDAISTLPDTVKNQIEDYLEKFEKELGFLNTNIRMAQMAQDANTNTAYLSAYLNNYDKGFTHYLKKLRVTYAYKDIPQDPVNLKYTLAALSEKYGFSTTRAFNQAFSNIMGVMPSKYIKALKNKG